MIILLMQIFHRATATLAICCLSLVFLTQCGSMGPDISDDPAWPTRVPDEIDFVRDVKPILEIRCLECHNTKDAAKYAGLNLETRKLAMTTGRTPPAIRPGDPDNSPFITVLKLDHMHPTNMPPAPDKIRGAPLEIFEKWIRDGAPWPEDVRLVRPQDWPE